MLEILGRQMIEEPVLDDGVHEPCGLDAGSSLHPEAILRCCKKNVKLLKKVTLNRAVSMQAEACIESLELGEVVHVESRVCTDIGLPDSCARQMWTPLRMFTWMWHRGRSGRN